MLSEYISLDVAHLTSYLVANQMINTFDLRRFSTFDVYYQYFQVLKQKHQYLSSTQSRRYLLTKHIVIENLEILSLSLILRISSLG